MVKSGSYTVKQPSIFGRLGTGIGQGLSEQVPKEIERYRLAEGLKNFEQESGNLTPLQQYSKLASIPGITPQMLQTFGELSKQQSLRNSYERRANRDNRSERPINKLDVNFPKEGQPRINKTGIQEEQQESVGQPQIQENNPLRQEAIPKRRWTPQRMDNEISQILADFPNMTVPEAVNLASQNEERELAQPAGEQAIDQYLKQVQEDADSEFTKQLETKLQKSKEGIYADITGENLQNLKRGMERELRSNPKATIKDVANRWTNKALDLAKAKSQLKGLSGRSFIDQINPLKFKETYSKLKSYQKIFADSGNSEEFFNTLKASQDKGGFDMSPQGAASISFPRSKNVKEFISNVKPSTISNRAQNSRKYAIEIEDNLTSGDSLLAIARDLAEKDPYFSQNDFFNQIREDSDNIRLNDRQKRELAEGESSDIIKSWGDMWILPWR